MNLLCIGNSFSQDACRYLHDVARAGGHALNTLNLYVGGCSLQMHHQYMTENTPAYELQYNGHDTGFHLTLQEGLKNRSWDVISLQQVSQLAAHPSSYEPYMSDLVAYVRHHAPTAKIVIHQTWAYEDGSDRLLNMANYPTAADMMRDVKAAYQLAAERIGADGIVPSGELLLSLLDAGIERVHRDTFHASLGLGRYALALLWYRLLCGASVLHNSYDMLDEPIATQDAATVKACVERFCPLNLSGQP